MVPHQGSTLVCLHSTVSHIQMLEGAPSMLHMPVSLAVQERWRGPALACCCKPCDWYAA